jgi:hypothetical protein
VVGVHGMKPDHDLRQGRNSPRPITSAEPSVPLRLVAFQSGYVCWNILEIKSRKDLLEPYRGSGWREVSHG